LKSHHSQNFFEPNHPRNVTETKLAAGKFSTEIDPEKGANMTKLKAFIESSRTINLSSVTKDKDKQERFEGFRIFSIN
jgi:hypothetical protein